MKYYGAGVNSTEPFTVIDSAHEESSENSHALFPTYKNVNRAPIADIDVQLQADLREKYPDLTLTTCPASNTPLIEFAESGLATATLDTENDDVIRWRGYIPPTHRGGQGAIGDAVFFAKYNYSWAGEDFIIYAVGPGFSQVLYILKEPDESAGEDAKGHCAKVDSLMKAAVLALLGDENKYVYVYDGFWQRSHELWKEVQKSSWDKVILDEKMKKALTSVSSNFFDSKDVYDRYGVPWKRGLIFHGPAGNGKTISIKALMKTLSQRKHSPVPTLYVKDAPTTYDLRAVFAQARRMTPCLLVLEDIETIVTPRTRSYFFNEVDGLEGNDGILMVASTNYLERLDPGLSKRPSRFDRKYLFPLPDHHERVLYAHFWQRKITDETTSATAPLPFPDKLCPAIADITDRFSFAFMQEAFVATLLAIAREGSDEDIEEDGYEGCEDVNDLADNLERASCLSWPGKGRDGGDEGKKHPELDGYKLWRVIKVQVRMLRKDLDSSPDHDPPKPPPYQAPSRYGDTQSSDSAQKYNSAPPIPPSGVNHNGHNRESWCSPDRLNTWRDHEAFKRDGTVFGFGQSSTEGAPYSTHPAVNAPSPTPCGPGGGFAGGPPLENLHSVKSKQESTHIHSMRNGHGWHKDDTKHHELSEKGPLEKPTYLNNAYAPRQGFDLHTLLSTADKLVTEKTRQMRNTPHAKIQEASLGNNTQSAAFSPDQVSTKSHMKPPVPAETQPASSAPSYDIRRCPFSEDFLNNRLPPPPPFKPVQQGGPTSTSQKPSSGLAAKFAPGHRATRCTSRDKPVNQVDRIWDGSFRKHSNVFESESSSAKGIGEAGLLPSARYKGKAPAAAAEESAETETSKPKDREASSAEMMQEGFYKGSDLSDTAFMWGRY